MDLLKAEPMRRAIAEAIKRLEHEGDQFTHEWSPIQLDRVFITPLDREDIHLLASRLDDVMDLIDGPASRVQIYQAGAGSSGAILMADVVLRSTQQLLVAVMGLAEEQGPCGARRLRPGEAAGRGGRLRLSRMGRPGCSMARPTPLS